MSGDEDELLMPDWRSADYEKVDRRLLLLIVALLASPFLAFGQSDVVETNVDWTDGTMTVAVTRGVGSIDATGPAAISRTQRSIRNDAPGIVLEAISRLPFDSTHTVGSLLDERDSLIAALERAANRAVAVDASSSADLQRATVTFRLDLYGDLATEFVEHDVPVPITPELGWIPHTEYTGVLIYAADELPLFGTDERARVEPTLFPGIHYTAGSRDLIYRLSESEYVDPARLGERGPAAYTSDVQATGLADRLGANPLRVLAIGVFGTRPTDLVISEQDAHQIMSSAHNRSLLREGRLVIVLDPSRL